MSLRSTAAVDPTDVPDPEVRRGYTTRGKQEKERNAAPTFDRRVRHWEKRWVKVGQMTVLRWERPASDGAAAQAGETSAAGASVPHAEPDDNAARGKRAKT